MAGSLGFSEAMDKAGPSCSSRSRASRYRARRLPGRRHGRPQQPPGPGAGHRGRATTASRSSSRSCPTSELLRYAIDLRSHDRWAGRFHAEHDHYDPLPQNLWAAGPARASPRRPLRRPRRVRRPAGSQLAPARCQGLGQDPGVGHGGHEVGVAVPPGQDVHVEVAGNAGAGGPAQVGADVEAVGPVGGLDGPDRRGDTQTRWPPTLRPDRRSRSPTCRVGMTIRWPLV